MADAKQDMNEAGSGETIQGGVSPGDGSGRRVPVEPSPEERLMQVDSAAEAGGDTSGEEGSERDEAIARIDDRAAEDARMDVRRREHSAD